MSINFLTLAMSSNECEDYDRWDIRQSKVIFNDVKYSFNILKYHKMYAKNNKLTNWC